MPSQEWVAANTDRIRWSLGWVQKRLEPIAPERVEKALAVLATTTKHACGEDELTWDVRSKEYRRLLGGYSAEVWTHAVDLHRKQSAFWPTIAELEAIMKPKDAELRTSAYRLRKMLQAAETGKCQPPADERRYDELSDEEKSRLDAMIADTKRKLAMAPMMEGEQA